MTESTVYVAIAILYQQGQFLMQLRDNIPSIVYPGHWGFFGGHIEPGETPEAALKRELLEEINYTPQELVRFGLYPDPGVVRHVYHAPLTVDLKDLVLTEGWDLGLLTPEAIRQGSHYSVQAGQACPLGRPFQKILLDFLNSESFSLRAPRLSPPT
jgi:8-oxo-dGTP pyrophosphatase MutT (NUDIX family)